MIYGYIRVSTAKQDYENQKHGILEYTNLKKLGHCEFVEETISSRKKYEDRDLSRLIKEMKEGDILVVSELSRIGRSIMEIMSIFKTLVEKKIAVHIIKSGFIIGEEKDKIQSSVLIFAFGLSAEIERELISQRTKEALSSRRSQIEKNGFFINKSGEKIYNLGRQKGTKIASKLDGKEKSISELLEKGVNVSSIAKINDVARSTMINFIKSRGLKSEKTKSDT